MQVKSKATVFEETLQAYCDDGSYNRSFFVCHSPVGPPPVTNDPSIIYWAGHQLAELTKTPGSQVASSSTLPKRSIRGGEFPVPEPQKSSEYEHIQQFSHISENTKLSIGSAERFSKFEWAFR